MPVTPFHIGPAAIVKAVFGEKFSITIFAFSQILIDLQPLFAMLGADIELHGLSHTYLGATLTGGVACILGKPLCQLFLKWWKHHQSLPENSILIISESISWKVAFSSALIGSYSHILLDSIMHADIQPFFPFQITNTLLGLVAIDTLHIFCAITGFIGLIGYFLVAYFLKYRQSKKA